MSSDKNLSHESRISVRTALFLFVVETTMENEAPCRPGLWCSPWSVLIVQPNPKAVPVWMHRYARHWSWIVWFAAIHDVRKRYGPAGIIHATVSRPHVVQARTTHWRLAGEVGQ